ncbi:cellulose binding domain-containing protein [Dactylosporangium matsuzakiense]|uniref:Glycoside hydrolase n=1 Tax=Dactylosporangium matsuzakiense TaxID=53360 RepID=A0A9W6KWZ7_9ACTN|nr:cellulose binding domain-containing protein [Dactylosporangium matsuzakiense]GLL08224.1 glycoside hydrolase [Dactylosporangium matsuzakiense]
MTTFSGRRLLGAMAALVAVAAGATAAVAHAAAAGCRVDYTVASQWDGGFGANVTVTNLGDPITTWTLNWAYPAGQIVTQAWSAGVTQSGTGVTAKDAGYNATIATNGTASFGFNAAWTGSNPSPTAFALNGVACTGAIPSTSSPGQSPPSSPTSSGSPPAAGSRAVIPFDQGWLFHYGEASGAQAPAFADTAWRHVDVPHDWSIEGPNPPADPFAQSAPSTGRGGYLPSGIGWYRKHFSLAATPAGRKVFVEFDGVMANASVYVNGTLIGTHPYGYTSFRYDVTAAVKTGGADNVIAVRTDTSQQPAERFYTGAGINRDVRLLTTDPVHIDQWATYVTTPQVSTSAATVHAQTAVVNDGSATVTVSVRGALTDPAGVALSPITTAARSVAPGASATFAFDVPVSSPKLWDLQSPNLYALTISVLSDGTAVDDDVTSVGIRSLSFNALTGMSLNGKTVKFQGVALHQDYHALGTAAPQRAMQRRLAQLKALGVNAIRTAHDPPSPAFLDLTDRMGFLVLDEFFDVWTGHKYADVGDYATYFNRTASAPTGTPPVPGAIGPVPWYQVDATSIVMRDRNHPSVAMWSTGNEIRDSLAARTPLLTRMVALSHALDPARPVTQALFRPGDSGDVTGATRTTVDVFGGNYRPDEVIQAASMAPARPGLFTEMGTDTSNWTTVMNNPGITGLFIWTGAAYLGEADGLWSNVESGFGLLDAVGTVRSIGYAWQKTWGAPTTTPPATGTTANRVQLTPDHTTVSTDHNDVSYVKATIADSSGRVVTGSAAAVTFSINGPGTIVAVDSGSPTQESFRGNVRKAYRGIAFALVRATGPGAITVTAAAGGLTQGTTGLTGTTTPFVPCTGACD